MLHVRILKKFPISNFPQPRQAKRGGQFPISEGLTLVEILIILAVLIALLAIVFALVNPFEQNKKSADVLARNTVAEFIQGANRYNANYGNSYPWNNTSCLVSGGSPSIVTPVPLSAMSTCISSMDFRSTFSSTPQSVLSNIYLNQPNPILTPPDSSTVMLCYLPQSGSAQKDANAKYLRNGYVAPSGAPSVNGYDSLGNPLSSGTCISAGGINYCYVCISN